MANLHQHPPLATNVVLCKASCLKAPYTLHRQQIIRCCMRQLTVAFCFVGWLQLTESPGGGCRVEHRLKVQPVLDAPALFSKLHCCTSRPPVIPLGVHGCIAVLYESLSVALHDTPARSCQHFAGRQICSEEWIQL